jgi:AmiR/NasT family two-component response regulator
MKSTLRIAVADDEPDMRDYFQRILPMAGHQVVAVAETGRQLVDQCRTALPDLVITDIKMPDMDGIEAARTINQEHEVPFILVSAYHDPELIERADADCILAYLVKPIKQADVGPAIAVAMRRFDQFRALRKEAGDLRQALHDRKIIERAKGIMMHRLRLDEPDVFHRLQKLASQRNRKLVDVAQSVLSAEETFQALERV